MEIPQELLTGDAEDLSHPQHLRAPIEKDQTRFGVILRKTPEGTKILGVDPNGVLHLDGPKAILPVEDRIHLLSRACPPEVKPVGFSPISVPGAQVLNDHPL